LSRCAPDPLGPKDPQDDVPYEECLGFATALPGVRRAIGDLICYYVLPEL